MRSVFLLSPANTAGKRAKILMNPGADFELAKRLRNARDLAAAVSTTMPVVLLGSIATKKYIEPLGEVFWERLVFPAEFVGRGDMSRGGLMLRSVVSGKELDYIPVATAVRKGARPPKLEKLDRRK